MRCRTANAAANPSHSAMRIAQVAPLYESVPPRFYGGTERVVSYLTEELVALGHDVTLFASGDSVTRARLVAARPAAIRLDANPLKSDVAAHFAMLHDLRARADDFDVLHFHLDPLPLAFFADCAERTVTTLHGRLDLEDLPGRLSALAHVPAGLDLRCATRPAAIRQLGGDGAPRHPARPAPSRHRHAATISPSSAASPRRSAWIARSASRSAPACR